MPTTTLTAEEVVVKRPSTVMPVNMNDYDSGIFADAVDAWGGGHDSPNDNDPWAND